MPYQSDTRSAFAGRTQVEASAHPNVLEAQGQGPTTAATNKRRTTSKPQESEPSTTPPRQEMQAYGTCEMQTCGTCERRPKAAQANGALQRLNLKRPMESDKDSEEEIVRWMSRSHRCIAGVNFDKKSHRKLPNESWILKPPNKAKEKKTIRIERKSGQSPQERSGMVRVLRERGQSRQIQLRHLVEPC